MICSCVNIYRLLESFGMRNILNALDWVVVYFSMLGDLTIFVATLITQQGHVVPGRKTPGVI